MVVAVIDNPSKESLFTVGERVAMLEELFGGRVEIGSFSGLFVEYAADVGADVVVKGLRTVDDYEYEVQMSQMNRSLTGMETVFMATKSDWSFISSSLVKEVAKLGGSVERSGTKCRRESTQGASDMTDEQEAPVAGPSRRSSTSSGRSSSDLQDTVDDLIVYLHEAKNVPLSGNAMVDREQFLGMLERIRADLPDELRAARWMVREREAFIARTNEKAGRSSIAPEGGGRAGLGLQHHGRGRGRGEHPGPEGGGRGPSPSTRDRGRDRAEVAAGRSCILDQVTRSGAGPRDELHQARPRPRSPDLK